MKASFYACIAVLALFTVTACAPDEAGETDDLSPETGELQTPEAEDPGAPLGGGPFESEVEASVSGELGTVDLEGMTLVVITDTGAEEEFEFSEETQVIGAAGIQGLAGQQGSRITVYYDESALGTPNVVRIEIQNLGPGVTP